MKAKVSAAWGLTLPTPAGSTSEGGSPGSHLFFGYHGNRREHQESGRNSLGPAEATVPPPPGPSFSLSTQCRLDTLAKTQHGLRSTIKK